MRPALPLAALGLLLLGAAAPDRQDAPPPDPDIVRMDPQQQHTVDLQTEPVVSQPIVRTLHVSGTIVLDPARTARLRPVAEARVLRLLVQPGEAVKPGDALVEFASEQVVQAQDNRASLQAEAHEAADGVAVAADALHRGEILARDGSLAWAEAERRRLLLAQARSRVISIRARLATLDAELAGLGAGTRLGIARLVTPIGGVVAEVNATTGGLIGPSMPDDAVVVADLSDVIALAQVPEGDAAEVRAGQQAGVTLSSGGTAGWSGAVVAVGAALDTRSRTLPVGIRLGNADGRLRSGMFVDVTLFDPAGRNGLIVPPSAVQSIASDQVAFTDEGQGRFRRHTLTLGVERTDWVEVTRGLSAGDTVVTNGSFALKAELQKSMLGGS